MTVADGRLRTTVVQAEGTTFIGAVELVIDGAAGPVTHAIAFGPGATVVDVAAPAGATRVRLDPDARLPRRTAAGAPLVPERALPSPG